MRTWQVEMAVVGLALVLVLGVTNGRVTEVVGALAVLASFGHGQVSDRLAEREARRTQSEVPCHRWSLRYFVAKEALWCGYFVAHRSWSALVGVVLFLLYPLWRRGYRGVCRGDG